MSVLLLWEHPQTVRTEFEATRCVINRASPNKGFLPIEEDATWGFYEDMGNDDASLQYSVDYVSNYTGAVLESVLRQDLQVFPRPDDLAILDLRFKTFAGVPAVNRIIRFSDESYTAGEKYYVIHTNSQGQARFGLRRCSRVLIHTGYDMKALDTMVPDKKTLSWADLVENGSFIDADRRGWY